MRVAELAEGGQYKRPQLVGGRLLGQHLKTQAYMYINVLIPSMVRSYMHDMYLHVRAYMARCYLGEIVDDGVERVGVGALQSILQRRQRVNHGVLELWVFTCST